MEHEFSLQDVKDSIEDAYAANLGMDPERVTQELNSALSKIDQLIHDEDLRGY